MHVVHHWWCHTLHLCYCASVVRISIETFISLHQADTKTKILQSHSVSQCHSLTVTHSVTDSHIVSQSHRVSQCLTVSQTVTLSHSLTVYSRGRVGHTPHSGVISFIASLTCGGLTMVMFRWYKYLYRQEKGRISVRMFKSGFKVSRSEERVRWRLLRVSF